MIGGTPTPVLMAGEIYSFETFYDPLIISPFDPKSTSFLPIRFPAATKISLKRRKIVSTTHINHRDGGSVKEVSGMGDWQIDIETTLIDPIPFVPGAYNPLFLRKLKNMKNMFSELGKVAIKNDLMLDMGISYMLIEEMDLPDGMYSSQTVKLKGLSDSNYDLKLFQTDIKEYLKKART
jgi:hypothetical protein